MPYSLAFNILSGTLSADSLLPWHMRNLEPHLLSMLGVGFTSHSLRRERSIMLTRNYTPQARTASGINILLGICLLLSPWVFGYRTAGSAAIWNSVIVGALIAILAASNCFSEHVRTGPNWINVLLALWTMISPLMYGYAANTGGLGDNLI